MTNIAAHSKQPAPRKRPPKVAKLLRSLNLPQDFPLSPHFASGQWYRTRGRRTYYFGKIDDPQAALEYYQSQVANFMAGRDLGPPQGGEDRLEVGDVVNAYLGAANRRVKSGELKPSTFDSYKATGADTIAALGRYRSVEDLRPEDFAKLRGSFAERFGPAELAKRIQVVRSAFKHAYESELMDRPMRFGPEFKKPPKRATRKVRQSKPPRLFEADDLRAIIDACGVPLRAMVLLGINCGWGNSDISDLPAAALDLDKGLADYPRPKTAIERQAVLWPETIVALREAIAERPQHKNHGDEGLVFVTKYGKRFVRYKPAGGTNRKGELTTRGSWTDGVRNELNKVLKSLDLYEPGVTFYALRHTFQTVAETCGDMPAVIRIMGHHDDSMAERYRERIDVERLRAVADHVHAWLWPEKGGEAKS